MSDPSGAGHRFNGILVRAKAILLTPATEWAVIEREPATTASLYRGYILILAAIGPVARFLHAMIFGYGVLGITYRPGLVGALGTLIATYALTLASVFVMALVVDALAPSFQGQKSQIQALKLVTYASTASWLAGIFSLIPGLGILGILGLYSAYLFYVGLPPMMKSPPAKSLAYTAVVVVAMIAVGFVISAVTWQSGLGSMGSISTSGDTTSGTVDLPGGGKVELGKLAQLGKALEQAAKIGDESTKTPGPAGTANPTAAGSPAVPTDTLKGFLPATLPGGLARTEISSVGGQIAGFAGASVEAKYAGDGRSLDLTVTDLGIMGAMAGVTGLLGISGDKETATSYSKVTQQNGRTIGEEYDRNTRAGNYTVIVGSRFMVHADGTSISMDDIRNAVKSVDLDKLESLAK